MKILNSILKIALVSSLVIALLATLNLTLLHIIYLPNLFYLKIQEGLLLVGPLLMLLMFKKYKMRIFNILAAITIALGIVNLISFLISSYI